MVNFLIVFCLNLRYLALSHVHLATLLTVQLAPVHSAVTDPRNRAPIALERTKVLGELALKYHRYTFTSIQILFTSAATRTVTLKCVNYT